jgi:hypothetical protein
MNTRAEAVVYLTSMGFHAQERDWSLGETIAVLSDPVEVIANFRIASRGVYIYARDGLWSIYNGSLTHPMADERRMPLQEACDVAAKILGHDSKG